MRIFEVHSNGYITGVGKGDFGEEITEVRYNNVLDALLSKPPATKTTDYRLTFDLAWDPYSVPPKPGPEPAVEDKAEAYDILMGVES